MNSLDLRKKELAKFSSLTLFFLAAYLLPLNRLPVEGPSMSAFSLIHEYARSHVLFCLVPAFFLAGAMSVFLTRESVLKYFGPMANRALVYAAASVSGSILAVCSCTILPLFAGIYRRGAGLGPATTFLYAGPAINVLALILSARVLGWDVGMGRAVGAVSLSILVGLAMAALFPVRSLARPQYVGA